jgi:hypothetical protein
MGISLGNDSMFLCGSIEVNLMGTCTENPRVGSSILFFGITVSNTYFAFSIGFLKEEG